MKIEYNNKTIYNSYFLILFLGSFLIGFYEGFFELIGFICSVLSAYIIGKIEENKKWRGIK